MASVSIMTMKQLERYFFLLLLLVSITAFGQDQADNTIAIDSNDIAMTDTVESVEEITYNFEDMPYVAALDSLLMIDIFPNSLDSSNYVYDFSATDTVIPTFHDSIYAQRMAYLNALSPFKLEYNRDVRGYIDLYTERKREQVSRMMGLAELYFPMFEEKLDQYNLPLEFKYLAVVESALNPSARSWVGAKGLWQFMYTTGKIYDLKVSSYVDERNDPFKATEAACQYFTKLYSIFGDWNLVLAAYNSGPGNVNKAIRRSGGKKDYWEIRRYLPRETRGYVPAFIAVNYVMSYANEHNLHPTMPIIRHLDRDTVVIKQTMRFDQISKMLDIPNDLLVFLNPSYKLEIIPYLKNRPYTLSLPKDKIGVFLANEDSIYKLIAAEEAINNKPMPQYVDMGDKIIHRVRRGEYLGAISEKYGVSVRSIMRWNNLRSTNIAIGQRLSIYPRKLSSAAIVSAPEPKKEEKKKEAEEEKTEEVASNESSQEEQLSYYTVQNGDTLWSIARKYPGISASNIKDWNNIRSEKRIKPGMKLKILNAN